APASACGRHACLRPAWALVRPARLGSIRPDNVHSCFACLSEAGTNPAMSQKSGATLTEKQDHYLAFIHTYSYMFGQPPAEADIQRHFRVSPPSVHQMIVTLERNGFIRRQPGVARSIQVLVAPGDLPILNWLGINQS